MAAFLDMMDFAQNQMLHSLRHLAVNTYIAIPLYMYHGWISLYPREPAMGPYRVKAQLAVLHVCPWTLICCKEEIGQDQVLEGCK